MVFKCVLEKDKDCDSCGLCDSYDESIDVDEIEEDEL